MSASDRSMGARDRVAATSGPLVPNTGLALGWRAMRRLRARWSVPAVLSLPLAVVTMAAPPAAAAGLPGPGFGEPMGPPGWFVAAFVLMVVAGIGLTLWRVTLARQVAEQSGLDPDQATAMTLLSDDGLDATYLAASLRRPTTPTPQGPASGGRSAADRLRELQQLRDEGLLGVEEYDVRRRAILDSL